MWVSAGPWTTPEHTLKSLLVAPLIEEAFFRGVLQEGLRRQGGELGQPSTAIVVTALCFGLAHLGSAPLTHCALVVVPALAIGWIYERSRSVLLCVAAHSACNAFWLTVWSAG